MSDLSFRFSHAITRKPGRAITGGLRAVDTGAPDLALMLAHHAGRAKLDGGMSCLSLRFTPKP